MQLIIIPDIFGKTPYLTDLALQLSEYYSDITVINPYPDNNRSFQNEAQAYQYFQQNCTLDRLTALLRQELENGGTSIDILGFSVGATAAWIVSEQNWYQNINRVICFYGSRIRERTAICPQVSTTLIFPAREKSFELEPLIQLLEKKINTEIIRTAYQHGFMNKESVNFSATAYRHFSKWLAEMAETHHHNNKR